MAVECPRCLLTNPDSNLTCECGFDLTPQIRRQMLGDLSVRRKGATEDREMRKRDFFLGLGLVWLLLVAGEWSRMRPELRIRKSAELLLDCLLVGTTDLAGAMAIGIFGWIGVWIALAYEGRKMFLCPKRTTLAVTVVAAGLLFISRTLSPEILLQHVLHASILLAVAAFAYYAGCRGWLGKW